jgi:hypothetical protein
MSNAQKISDHEKARAFIRDRVAMTAGWTYVNHWEDEIHGVRGGAVAFSGTDSKGHDVNPVIDYELPIEPFALAKRVAVCLDGKLPITLRGPSRPM